MAYNEMNRLELVEGGTTIRQGDHFTLSFKPRDYSGAIVDLTGKTIDVVLASDRGIEHTTTGTYDSTEQVIRFSVNEMINAGDMWLDITVTDPNDANYRRKFPSSQSNGRLKFTPSTDDLNAAGVAYTTVTQLENNLTTMQQEYEQQITPQIETLTTRVNDGVTKFTDSTEVVDARMGEVNLREFNRKTTEKLAEKATKAELQQVSLSFKESYATLTDLQTAYPSGDTYNHTVNADGLIYTYVNASWVSTGVQANGTGIADSTVAPVKTTFFVIGKNLFNQAAAEQGKTLTSNGGTMLNADYATSEFIPVLASSDYAVTSAVYYAIYDEAKALISYSSWPNVLSMPVNAAYLRIAMPIVDLGKAQVEKGSARTSYEPFKRIIPANYTEKHQFVSGDIPKNSLYPELMSFMTIGKNLFNPEKMETGKYVNQTTGALASNASYNATEFISVKSQQAYAFSHTTDSRIAYYDVNKKFISGAYPAVSPVTTPAGAVFIRYSFRATVTDVLQIEEGTGSTPYEPFGYMIPKLLNSGTGESITAVTDTDHYGKFHLQDFQSQASKYENPNYAERLEIAILGDSWVRSGHRIATPLRNKLKGIYGDAGLGFVGFSEIRLGNGETVTSTTGVWEAINKVKGIDMRQYQSTEVGATLKLVTYEPSDYLEIHHIQQVGSYRYRVDGGTWVIVDTTIGTFITDNTFVAGNITLEIEVLSGMVTLLNAYLYHGNRGSVVHKLGYGGATAGDYAGVDRAHFISEFTKTNINAVGILLGTNDMAQNVPIADFKTNILEIIDRIKTARALTDVFLISPTQNNLTAKLHTIAEYDAALAEIAVQESVAFVSLFHNFGDYATSNARGLFEDDVHPNADGGYIISNVVYDRLLRLN